MSPSLLKKRRVRSANKSGDDFAGGGQLKVTEALGKPVGSGGGGGDEDGDGHR